MIIKNEGSEVPGVQGVEEPSEMLKGYKQIRARY